jgi:ParB-like chromosome segregation protein Spo0J
MMLARTTTTATTTNAGRRKAAKIELRAIADLRPYPRNARVHSPEQIKRIAAAITEFGWTMPLLIDEDRMILAGHGRVEAAKLLGMDTVPVIVARGWSEARKAAYVGAFEAARVVEAIFRAALGELNHLPKRRQLHAPKRAGNRDTVLFFDVPTIDVPAQLGGGPGAIRLGGNQSGNALLCPTRTTTHF